jgi:GNAT superfamily N-acetyltransferase
MHCSERLDGSRTDVKWEHRMTLRIRPATVEDVPALAALLDAYMQEVFSSRWHGSRDALIADGFGAKFATILAESSDGQVVAFVAWQHSYDLHHCVPGVEVIDMYVAPAFRGRAVSLLLIAELASQVRAFGGLFVKGQAVTRRGCKASTSASPCHSQVPTASWVVAPLAPSPISPGARLASSSKICPTSRGITKRKLA